MIADFNLDNYYLLIQNNEEQFSRSVGPIKGVVNFKDSQGVDIPFFRMADNNIKELKPIAGIIAFGWPKENNQIEIFAIEETEDLSKPAFRTTLEETLKTSSSYELFIAIAPNDDLEEAKYSRVELVKRLRENHIKTMNRTELNNL
jgi:hypothetical protein